FAALPWGEMRKGGLRLVLRTRQAVPGAHAKGMVDGDNQKGPVREPAAGMRKERSRESQRQQQQERETEAEQQKVPQAAMLHRTLRPAIEEHQRTEWQRRGAVFPKQVQPEGQPGGDNARGNEPWRKEAH